MTTGQHGLKPGERYRLLVQREYSPNGKDEVVEAVFSRYGAWSLTNPDGSVFSTGYRYALFLDYGALRVSNGAGWQATPLWVAEPEA